MVGQSKSRANKSPTGWRTRTRRTAHQVRQLRRQPRRATMSQTAPRPHISAMRKLNRRAGRPSWRHRRRNQTKCKSGSTCRYAVLHYQAEAQALVVSRRSELAWRRKHAKAGEMRHSQASTATCLARPRAPACLPRTRTSRPGRRPGYVHCTTRRRLWRASEQGRGSEPGLGPHSYTWKARGQEQPATPMLPWVFASSVPWPCAQTPAPCLVQTMIVVSATTRLT